MLRITELKLPLNHAADALRPAELDETPRKGELPRACATRRISRSHAGLSVITAAVALTDDGETRIALDGVADIPIRLRDVEAQQLEGEALEMAVRAAVFPREDLRGSVAYKRYIAGVVVADLYADCQQMGEELA